MDHTKITAIAAIFLAFSSFLGVLIATVYYAFQIKNLGTSEVILG